MKRTLAKILASMLLFGCAAGCGQNGGPAASGSGDPATGASDPLSASAQKTDYPTRDINMIVPFGAGGATDLIARSISEGMKDALGVNIAVTNMPGSASAVGNEYVFSSEHDGYNILCQPTDISTIAIMGQSELTYEDWNILYVAAAVPTVICVAPDSPINTIEDLVAEMKKRSVIIATSDSGCAFTRGVGLVLEEEPGCQKPEFIPSGGGANAALSCVKGDVEVVACGLPECVEYIRSGDLKPIVYYGESAITLEGAKGDVRIPWIADSYPSLKDQMPFGGWVSVAVPAGTDPGIAKTLADAVEKAAQREEFVSFLESKTFVPLGLKGEEANEWAKQSTYTNSWLLYDMGFTSTSPETFGWPRP